MITARHKSKKLILRTAATGAILAACAGAYSVYSRVQEYSQSVKIEIAKNFKPSQLEFGTSIFAPTLYTAPDVQLVQVADPIKKTWRKRQLELSRLDRKLDGEIAQLQSEIKLRGQEFAAATDLKKTAPVDVEALAILAAAAESPLSLHSQLQSNFARAMGAELEYPVVIDPTPVNTQPKVTPEYFDHHELLANIHLKLNIQKPEFSGIQKLAERKVDIQVAKQEIPQARIIREDQSNTVAPVQQNLLQSDSLSKKLLDSPPGAPPVPTIIVKKPNSLLSQNDTMPSDTATDSALNPTTPKVQTRTLDEALAALKSKKEDGALDIQNEYSNKNTGEKDSEYSNEYSKETGTDEVHSNAQQTQTETGFQLTVLEGLTNGAKPLQGAEVQILGTEISFTSSDAGLVGFNGIKVDGVLPVIIRKAGFLYRRLDLYPGKPATVELVSEKYVQTVALTSGRERDGSSSFLFGELYGLTDKNLTNYKVEAVNAATREIRKTTPLYLDATGKIETNRTRTSPRGQFAFPDLKPGTYSIRIISADGVVRAPHTIHVGAREGVIKRFGLGYKALIKGRVLNAAKEHAPYKEVSVKLAGQDEISTTTNDKGQFQLNSIYIDCLETNYLEIERASLLASRVQYSCEALPGEFTAYVFPKKHFEDSFRDASRALNSEEAQIFGHVSYKDSVKVQLWGADEFTPRTEPKGVDFYYDRDGLNPNLNRTIETGNFGLFSAPTGFSYLQVVNKYGNTLSFWPVYLAPNTALVHTQ